MINKFLELGNRYASKSDWKDFALVKFCLCAMGILIGVQIPKKDKPVASCIAGTVFLATYIPLMTKIFGCIKEMLGEEDDMYEDWDMYEVEKILQEEEKMEQ